MFEILYGEKLTFNWNSMKVLINRKGNYEELDLNRFDTEEISSAYVDWVNKLDKLALEYKSCKGYDFKDCPVDDSNRSYDMSLYNKKSLRIEINMFLFVGIRLGFIVWEWGSKFFVKTSQMILFKKWFDKGYIDKEVYNE